MAKFETGDGFVFGFNGQYAWLSNFYDAPMLFTCDGITMGYPTVEHAFQAAKTLDAAQRLSISRADTPGLAKAAGRKVTLRPDWELIKRDVIHDCLVAKFSQHADLRLKLMQTDHWSLVEANTWGDRYWGTDMSGTGENWLGRTLEVVREGLLRL